jgi:hypothetical protein
MGINMESSRQPTVNSRQLSVYNAFFAWLKAKFEKENPPRSPFAKGVRETIFSGAGIEVPLEDD